jgi:hypothetical protein
MIHVSRPFLVPAKGENESAPILEEPTMVVNFKASILEKLVGHLVSFLMCVDPLFISIFLCIYRHCATTQQVLDLLFTR